MLTVLEADVFTELQTDDAAPVADALADTPFAAALGAAEPEGGLVTVRYAEPDYDDADLDGLHALLADVDGVEFQAGPGREYGATRG